MLILPCVRFHAPAAPSGGFPGTPLSLTDNMNDNSKDTGKWNATTVRPSWSADTLGGTVSEASGQVSIAPTPSTYNIEGYSSVSAFDLSPGRVAWVHAKSAPTDSTATFGFWNAGATEYIRWAISRTFGGNTVACYKANYGDSETLFTGAYNATDYAWLAIRYDNSNSTFKVYSAPDVAGSPGTAVLRGTSALANPVVTAMRVGFFANSGVGSPPNIVFDGFTTSD